MPENPLLPNQRLRAMYRALLEIRAAAPHLDRGHSLPGGFEPCWIAPAFQLETGDLASDGRHSVWIDTLRIDADRTRALMASPARALLGLPRPGFAGSGIERVLCATGAAWALRASRKAVVVFAERDELSPAQWQRAFELALASAVPLVYVLLPGGAGKAVDFDRLARRCRASGSLPVIPVDAGDAVALYRVAQEAMGRAREDGLPAAIECHDLGTDPLALLERHLLAKHLETRPSLDRMAAANEAVFARASSA